MAPSQSSDAAHIAEVKLQRLQGGQASIYFASVIGGLILIFAVAHWSSWLLFRLHLEKAIWWKSCETPRKALRRFLLGRKLLSVTILPERVTLVIVYFGVNIGVSFWDIDWHHYTTFANRLGWSVCDVISIKPMVNQGQGFIMQYVPRRLPRS